MNLIIQNSCRLNVMFDYYIVHFSVRFYASPDL